MGVLDLAHDREHRGRVLTGRVDADGEIRGPHAARTDTGGGSTGELAVRLGHEGGATLMARGDDADTGITERVEEAEERFAGDREGVADAGAAQRVGNEAPDGARALGGGGFGGGGFGSRRLARLRFGGRRLTGLDSRRLTGRSRRLHRRRPRLLRRLRRRLWRFARRLGRGSLR